MKFTHEFRWMPRGAVYALIFGFVFLLTAASPAFAHQDPAGCTLTGGSNALGAFFDYPDDLCTTNAECVATIPARKCNTALGHCISDQAISPADPLPECTAIVYVATIGKSATPGTCAFQGVSSAALTPTGWTLTTPDGTVHPTAEVVPAGGVPCIGGDLAEDGCNTGPDSFDSNPIPYIVDEADGLDDGSGGLLLSASFSYRAQFSHTSVSELNNQPILGTGIEYSIELCPTGDCADGECTTDASGTGVCTVSSATTICRTGSGDVCDPDESCPGDGPDCPADDITSATTICRTGSGDVCDPDESCPGTAGGACPADDIASATTICRTGSGDVCDPDESCPGTAGDACPADEVASATTECTAGGSTETCSCPGVAGETCPETCAQPEPTGCRITAGGLNQKGDTDPNLPANSNRSSFGGQVGASCGCIGCSDDFDHIQGQWQYTRQKRAGKLHVSDYNSLTCDCAGVLDGGLCNPDDPIPGPEPRSAPANLACFTGVGTFDGSPAAFRVEVEDRGEPSVGKRDDGTQDVYVVIIWKETTVALAEARAQAVCCEDVPVLPPSQLADADITDGGDLIHGNIQIHPVTPNTAKDRCPVPVGSCLED